MLDQLKKWIENLFNLIKPTIHTDLTSGRSYISRTPTLLDYKDFISVYEMHTITTAAANGWYFSPWINPRDKTRVILQADFGLDIDSKWAVIEIGQPNRNVRSHPVVAMANMDRMGFIPSLYIPSAMIVNKGDQYRVGCWSQSGAIDIFTITVRYIDL